MDIRNRLIERLSRAAAQHGRSSNIKRQRDFLLKCLLDFNYIKSVSNISDDDEEEEDEYRHFFNAPSLPISSKKNFTQDDTYGFNRTFIGPGNDRLSEIQKRGIHSEESKFNKVSEQIDTTLNVLLQNNINLDIQSIKKTALNIYLNILRYYSENNPYNLKENKGSLKRGYIALALIYSIKYYNINISDKDIVYILGFNMSDLPNARKSIKNIFKNIKDYEFIFLDNKKKLCMLPLPPELQDLVNKIMNSIGIYTDEFMIASINYVCNKLYPSRVKILINQELTFVTYDILSKYCGGISSPVIKKNTDFIINFINKNPDKFIFL